VDGGEGNDTDCAVGASGRNELFDSGNGMTLAIESPFGAELEKA
jgi:hypothetical protein